SVTRAMPSLAINGWRAEQDPVAILEAVTGLIQDLARVVAPDHWASLVLTTQRGTMFVLDENGVPLLPMLSWLDRRGLEVQGHVAADRWDWIQGEPAVASEARKLRSLASWLTEKFTGEAWDTSSTVTPERRRVAERLPAIDVA